MADLPETNPTRGVPAAPEVTPADPPLFALRVNVSYFSSILLMLPVSFFSGYVTGGVVYVVCSLTFVTFLGEQTAEIAGVLSVIAGFTSGLMTIFYFLIQLDDDYTNARLRGQLQTHLPTRCPACQAALVVGQMVCAGCDNDLRIALKSNHPYLPMRGLPLASFALATVPLANAALVIAALVAGLVLDRSGARYSEVTHLGVLTCAALSAAVCVILLRVPRALVLWRLLNAEDRESGAESSLDS